MVVRHNSDLGLDDLRRFAVARSLFPPTTLARALDVLGFVQADPIRAPARAQDLILRHRVAGYRAGDLERRYPTLDVEEGVFINYGFLARPVYELLHPRTGAGSWPAGRRERIEAILEFVRGRGAVHPRDVDCEFSHGTVTNYWGGSSNATTHLLDLMHYHGLLRVVRREAGIRVYAATATATPAAPFDPLVWDRQRFERFWGWAYRFEAYTPQKRRRLGYYALPLLWRDRVIGWGNVAVTNGTLDARLGYVSGRAPRARGFRQALEAELERMRAFLLAER